MGIPGGRWPCRSWYILPTGGQRANGSEKQPSAKRSLGTNATPAQRGEKGCPLSLALCSGELRPEEIPH